jgi:5-formyltetrahydrofolate cyclo-ligase
MGSSILQAILGGVAGGASGISEAREQRRLEEEQRQKAEEAKRQAERQAMLDRIGLVEKGFVPQDQMGAMDMPGATPRTPFMSQALASGERMVMEKSPQMRAHETEMRKATAERGVARAGEERTAAAAEQRSQSIDAALKAAGVSGEDRELVRSGALRANDVMLTANQRESMAFRRQQAARAEQAARAGRGEGKVPSLPSMGMGEASQAAIGAAWLRSLPANQQAAAMTRINQLFTDIPQLRGKGMIAAYYAMTPEERAQAEAAGKPQSRSSTDPGIDAIASRYGVESSGSTPPALTAQPAPTPARPAMAQPAAPAARPDTQPSLAPPPAARPDTQPAPAARPGGTFSSMAGIGQTPEEISPMDDPELRAAKEIIAQGAPRDEVIALYEQRTGKRWPKN